ncbi:MAG: carbon-nitrogen hydrolase family protein [Akkermansiaceae bacterium]|nr:carbon-nitrogen hydrolase family protein [Akkermansiaceae bacterium]
MPADSTFTAAAVQMRSGADKHRNLAAAERLVAEAAGLGARVVALPEMFNCLAAHEEMARQAETIPGETSERMGTLARRHGIFLLAGSIAEMAGGDGPPRIFNTSLLFGPSGEELARYRKIHLFDVDLEDGPHLAESRWFSPGDEVRAVATPLGRFGLSICYDLRFPSLYTALSRRGTDIVFVPSAFTAVTGEAHWEVLLRARAIESQAIVIAPNQCRGGFPGVETYGHSAIIDPWGRILASAGDDDGEAVVSAGVSLDDVRRIRRQLPALEHRRDLR